MFGKRFLRCDFNICRADGFHVLPSFIIYSTGIYIEVSISLFNSCLYFAFSTHSFDEE